MGWVLWRGAEAKREAWRAARESLFVVGREIMDQADTEVPFRDGPLRASGKVTRSRSQEPRVRLSFGGRGVPYAVRWHEGKAKRGHRRPRFRGGRKKHYLRDPFNRTAPVRLPNVLRMLFRRRLQGA